MTDPERPADTTRVDPATAEQPGVESPRRPSFRQRWAHVISSTHPPRQWAVIAAAIRTADAVPSDEFGEPVVRGDEAWCRVAVTALESPSSATAAQRLPDALPQRCLADADLLWAWLNAPAVYSHDGRVVADGLDLVDWNTASDEATHQAVENLLTHAQDAGVYGVRGYRVEAPSNRRRRRSRRLSPGRPARVRARACLNPTGRRGPHPRPGDIPVGWRGPDARLRRRRRRRHIGHTRRGPSPRLHVSTHAG